jgi:glucose/arabinose dehydrogenase
MLVLHEAARLGDDDVSGAHETIEDVEVATARKRSPIFNGVAVGPNGSIYVSDDGANAVYEFNQIQSTG